MNIFIKTEIEKNMKQYKKMNPIRKFTYVTSSKVLEISSPRLSANKVKMAM